MASPISLRVSGVVIIVAGFAFVLIFFVFFVFVLITVLVGVGSNQQLNHRQTIGSYWIDDS